MGSITSESIESRIPRLEDIHEITNIMGRRAYLHSTGRSRPQGQRVMEHAKKRRFRVLMGTWAKPFERQAILRERQSLPQRPQVADD